MLNLKLAAIFYYIISIQIITLLFFMIRYIIMNIKASEIMYNNEKRRSIIIEVKETKNTRKRLPIM